MTTCPACKGNAVFHLLFISQHGLNSKSKIDCDVCGATGSISDEQLGWIERGAKPRNTRVESGVTMRDFAKRHGLDVGDLSKAERGAIDPSFLENLK